MSSKVKNAIAHVNARWRWSKRKNALAHVCNRRRRWSKRKNALTHVCVATRATYVRQFFVGPRRPPVVEFDPTRSSCFVCIADVRSWRGCLPSSPTSWSILPPCRGPTRHTLLDLPLCHSQPPTTDATSPSSTTFSPCTISPRMRSRSCLRATTPWRATGRETARSPRRSETHSTRRAGASSFGLLLIQELKEHIGGRKAND